MRHKILIFGVVAIMAACQSEKKTDEVIDSATTAVTNISDSLTYRYDSVKVYSRKPASINPQVTDTAKAVISYPIFEDEALNTFTLNKILSSSAPDTKYHSYDEYARSFMKGFDDFQLQNKDRIQTWFLTINTKVVRQTPKYLSLFITYINFSGGAHPNSAFTYANYDPSTRKEVILDSLLTPEGSEKLNAIGEKIFRKNENLSATESLKDKYFFEKDQFKLNNNFTITDKGLLFLYNPYEIKAYAYGTTELLIPFSELKDISRPNSLLSN